MVKIKKNWRAYHLIKKKTGNIEKYWLFGDSPSEIRKRKGIYDQRIYALIPAEKHDTTTSIKKHLRKSVISKRNLKRRKK